MEKDNISDDDLEILTDKVLQKLIERSSNPRWHQMNSPMTVGELIQGQLPFQESTEEMLVAEIARLTTLLNMYAVSYTHLRAHET